MNRAYLKNLDLNEISLVDKGASGNETHRPKVVLFKRDASTNVAITIKETKVMPQKMDKTMIEKFVSLFRKSLEEETTKDDLGDIMAKLTPEEQERVKQAMAMAAAKTAEPPKADPEPATKRADVPEDVRKQLEEQEARTKAQEAENAALKKRLDEKDDAEKLASFVKRAAEFDHVPGLTTEERGKLLKVASEKLTKEEYEKVEKSFRLASETIRKGNLFKERGSTGGGESSAYEKIKSIAKSMREKDSKLSEAEAITTAIRENPDLAKEYQAEQRA